MSRRSSQSGSIEKKGNAFYVRFASMYRGKRSGHTSARICPANVCSKRGLGFELPATNSSDKPAVAPSCTQTSLLSNVA